MSCLLALALLMGCGASEGDRREETSDDSTSPPTLVKVRHADAMKVVQDNDARVTVVNFWATWCVPCVEEFPAFVKLERTLEDRGVEVMFISTDFPNQKDKVVSFLAEHGVTGTSYLKTGTSTAFVNNFSEEWSGAVPATFVYDQEGTLLAFWEGKVSYEELKKRVTRQLKEV